MRDTNCQLVAISVSHVPEVVFPLLETTKYVILLPTFSLKSVVMFFGQSCVLLWKAVYAFLTATLHAQAVHS